MEPPEVRPRRREGGGISPATRRFIRLAARHMTVLRQEVCLARGDPCAEFVSGLTTRCVVLLKFVEGVLIPVQGFCKPELVVPTAQKDERRSVAVILHVMRTPLPSRNLGPVRG